jgi:hypothetical protein
MTGRPYKSSGTSSSQHEASFFETEPDRIVPMNEAESKTLAEDFAAFWLAYPVHIGRLAALKAYAKARKLAPAADILAGLTATSRINRRGKHSPIQVRGSITAGGPTNSPNADGRRGRVHIRLRVWRARTGAVINGRKWTATGTSDESRRPYPSALRLRGLPTSGRREPTTSPGRADWRVGTRLRVESVLGICRSRAGPGQTVSRTEGDEVSTVIGRPRLPRVTPAMKACSRCHETKVIAEFNYSAKAPDGRQYWCKGCFRRLPVLK